MLTMIIKSIYLYMIIHIHYFVTIGIVINIVFTPLTTCTEIAIVDYVLYTYIYTC